MKKFWLLCMICAMLLGAAGCGDPGEDSQPTDNTTQATVPVSEETTQPTQSTQPTQPTVTEPAPTVVTGYTMPVPEGFEVTLAEDDRTVYSSPDAPGDASRIEIEISDKNEDILLLDETAFEAMYEDVENFGKIYALEQSLIDGMPALFADYSIEQDGIYYHIYEYHVVADENYMFRFSDGTDENDWLGLYAQSATDINMLTVNEGVRLDYSDLEKYNLPCGISLYAAAGLQEQDAPGFTACIGSSEVIILVMEDNKAEHALEDLSLQEYADLVSQANDLDSFELDNYGNLYVEFYSSDGQGAQYFNNLTVKETGDSFWVFQMTCAADDQTDYARQFPVWSTSIGA